MARFEVTIKVDYDEASMPDGMREQLRRNVERCVQRDELLNDPNLEAIVDEWSVEVKE
jgi:hypothetical protein